MSEEGNTIFTTEEVLQQAQADFTATWLSTIAYLKEQNLSPVDWSAWLGRRFAPGWEGFKGQGANEVARITALNCVAFGGTLRSSSGDESRAELVIEGWPSADLLEFAQITQTEADVLWASFEQIIPSLGLQFHWQREGNTVKITISR